MTLSIPAKLEQKLRSHAAHRKMSVKQLVSEALTWYTSFEPATLDELAAWQDTRDEALQLVEEEHP